MWDRTVERKRSGTDIDRPGKGADNTHCTHCTEESLPPESGGPAWLANLLIGGLMRNLSRALALAAALILTGLTAQASAAPLGSCFVRCFGAGFPPPSYTVSATQADCCSGNIPNHCPAGSTPVPSSWNSSRCRV